LLRDDPLSEVCLFTRNEPTRDQFLSRMANSGMF
jgi:hypothetical protein